MSRFSKIFVMSLVFFSLASSAGARQASLTEEEKLAKGWVVRKISYGSDDSIIIVDVKALINASPKRVWNLLSDVNHWSSWMPVVSRGWAVDGGLLSEISDTPEKKDEVYIRVSASKPGIATVDNSGKTSVTTFEEFDLPWPINNDWVLRRYLFDATDAKFGSYKVSWKQLFKNTEGRGGKWEISRNNGGSDETLFKYYFRVKRKDGVPKKLFEIIISKTVDRFINAIRRNAEIGVKGKNT